MESIVRVVFDPVRCQFVAHPGDVHELIAMDLPEDGKNKSDSRGIPVAAEHVSSWAIDLPTGK